MSDYEELKAVFQVFDQDGSDAITYDELGNILTGMGISVNKALLMKTIQKFDTNNDGEISFTEFQAMMQDNMGNDEEVDELAEAFKVFDKDGDGTITAKEIEEVFNALGEEKMTREKAEMMIASVDEDGNGAIDFQEFRRMMMDAPPEQK